MSEIIRLRLIVLITSIVAIFLVSVFAIYRQSEGSDGVAVSSGYNHYAELGKELSSCIDHVTTVTKKESPSFDELKQFWQLCENQMYDQLLLNDFAIRREKFEQNTLDERVNLWLVVAITLSGVILSGAQLTMSYRLAQLAKSQLDNSSELVIEQGKLSIKSAYVGLLTMTLSLAFFAIYVKWIYQMQDVNMQKPSNLIESASHPLGKLLDVPGTLGWPDDDKKPKPEEGKSPEAPGKSK